MVKCVLCVLAITLLVLAPLALADWDPADPAKWVQMPDMTEMGIDVNASNGFILGDDFECTERGIITEVHIWGSWLNDYLPFGTDPTAVDFIVSFHWDIPADQSPTGYSMPGVLISYVRLGPADFTARTWSQGILEGWLEPPEQYIFPADQVIWQYNLDLGDRGLYQDGTPDNPVVYWIDIQAIPHDPDAFFGWKTSDVHWNDDAVWTFGSEPYEDEWNELRYPPDHPLYPLSIDLAFVLVNEPVYLDWGDAPEFPGAPGYPTMQANNGANHVIGGPWLGDATDAPDSDFDGQPDANALGDDTYDGNDDEDGVQIPALMVGQMTTIVFEVQDPAGGQPFVDGWIDFNRDLQWDASEQVVTGQWAPGVHSVAVYTPPGSVLGQTFSRWRINSAGPLPDTGPAIDGEVEDHEVWIEEDISSKWLQTPDLAETGIDVHATESFILADDFLCTEPGRITEVYIWGSWSNDEPPYGTDPGAVLFNLSFHEDIPDSESALGYSMPGDVLWWRTFYPGDFEFSTWAYGIDEGYMIPPYDYWFPGDHVCWLYHFFLPLEDTFFQSGTEAHPKVYWLDLQAVPFDPDAWFGWKTSLDHWNDDAVWADGYEPYIGMWSELIYPPGHPMAGQSIDLAFRLVMDPNSGVPVDEAAPEGVGMFQNVPNPFAGSTTIRYALPVEGRVKLEVFDVSGRLVDTLVDGTQAAGMRTAVWEGRDSRGNDLPSGVYFYRLSSCNETRTMKMLLLR
jgi:hypothetical protein